MAQTYEQWKKSYEGMTSEQQKQYNDILKTKGADYIGNQYMSQYNAASTPKTTSSNTWSSYTSKPEYAWQWSTSSPTVNDTSWDKWNGTYTYNEKSWYYESNWTSGWTPAWTTDKGQQVRDYWNSLTAEQQQKAAAQDKMKTVMQQYGLTVKPSEWTSAWWTP